MMRHVGMHDRMAYGSGQPLGCEVHRFIESIISNHGEFAQSLEVARRGVRIEGQRETRRVWSHDEILCQPTSKAESGHSKRSILIVLIGADGGKT